MIALHCAAWWPMKAQQRHRHHCRLHSGAWQRQTCCDEGSKQPQQRERRQGKGTHRDL